MALSEKAIHWINTRSNDDIQQIIAEICENKGVVTKEQYSKIMAVPERSVYEGVRNGSIPSFDICSKQFPYINK